MSRKHFEALAAEFRAQIEALRGASHNCMTPDRVELAVNATKDAIDCVCRVAADANPNFDRARFYAACGL